MSWLTWPFRILFFLLWFAVEVVKCNASVIRDNLTPGQNSTPGIAEVVTECRTEFEVTLLAVLITLTPGTLTVGAHAATAPPQRTLHVHGMYCADADVLRAEARRIESHMLAAVRRKGAES